MDFEPFDDFAYILYRDKQNDMSKVFVSYKRVDENKVFPIVGRMESELGFKFWMDFEGIDGDRQFTSVIINAIKECDLFLFMYSKAHEQIVDFECDYTVRELYFAQKRHKRIVFIDIEGTNLPDWFDFNFPQRQVTYANDIRRMNKLVDDIRKWLRLPLPDSSPNHSGPHPRAIDLGLPSGTKWASCNVGADKPEDYGCYYAWGETKEKKSYDWITYIHCDGSSGTCHDLGSDIAGTKYDVAHLEWGGHWRMPTLEQFKELLEHCKHKWITQNGVKGRKFTSKINGNSVFLPAAGYRWDDYLDYVDIGGNYWSSTQNPTYSGIANGLSFDSGYAHWYYYYYYFRHFGHTVRPVSRI